MTSVGDWMSRQVVVIASRTRVRDAEAIMGRHSVSHLLVVDDGHLLGVLCTCDLANAPEDDVVARHMATPPLTVLEAAPIAHAAELLAEAQIGCLPVVRRGDIVGIVTHTDLRRAGAIEAATACSACGTHHHVRPDPRGSDVPYCTDCVGVAAAVEGYEEELGEGD